VGEVELLDASFAVSSPLSLSNFVGNAARRINGQPEGYLQRAASNCLGSSPYNVHLRHKVFVLSKRNEESCFNNFKTLRFFIRLGRIRNDILSIAYPRKWRTQSQDGVIGHILYPY